MRALAAFSPRAQGSTDVMPSRQYHEMIRAFSHARRARVLAGLAAADILLLVDDAVDIRFQA